jgi:hypothetical protein
VSFSGRIRLFLVAIALLPPLLMMAVVYVYSGRQQDIEYRRSATQDLARLQAYHQQFAADLAEAATAAASGSWLARTTRLAASRRVSELTFDDLQGFGFDFAEILDSNFRVVASAHRPGLVGETKRTGASGSSPVPPSLTETVEYDIAGPHAALAATSAGRGGFRLYAGRYLDSKFEPIANLIVNGEIATAIVDTDSTASDRLGRMTAGTILPHGRL